MKRYNCKDFPAEMVECDDGYWVKHEDVVDVINAAVEAFQENNCDLVAEAIKNSVEINRLKSTLFFAGCSITIVIAIAIIALIHG